MTNDEARQVADDAARGLEQAWNAADGPAFAAPFTDDADFVDIRGAHHTGRQAVAAGHQAIFDTVYRGSTNRYSVTHARLLAGDVIVAHVPQTLDAPSGPLAGTHPSIATMVLVRAADGWRIAAFHNALVQAQPAGPPSSSPR
jgi:uncharacterized protein (TIGR02246 family)